MSGDGYGNSGETNKDSKIRTTRVRLRSPCVTHRHCPTRPVQTIDIQSLNILIKIQKTRGSSSIHLLLDRPSSSCGRRVAANRHHSHNIIGSLLPSLLALESNKHNIYSPRSLRRAGLISTAKVWFFL